MIYAMEASDDQVFESISAILTRSESLFLLDLIQENAHMDPNWLRSHIRGLVSHKPLLSSNEQWDAVLRRDIHTFHDWFTRASQLEAENVLRDQVSEVILNDMLEASINALNAADAANKSEGPADVPPEAAASEAPISLRETKFINYSTDSLRTSDFGSEDGSESSFKVSNSQSTAGPALIPAG